MKMMKYEDLLMMGLVLECGWKLEQGELQCGEVLVILSSCQFAF